MIDPETLTLAGAGLFVGAYGAKKAYDSLLKQLLARAAHADRTELADRKAELDRYAETIKHAMARDLLNADMLTKSRYRVYPRMSKRLHIATGAVNAAFKWIRWDWFDDTSAEDFRMIMAVHGVSSEAVEPLAAQYETDKEGALYGFKHELRSPLERSARIAVQSAENCVLLGRLYCTDEVIELSQRTLTELRQLLGTLRAFSVTEMGAYASGKFLVLVPSKEIQLMLEHLADLDMLMRRELSPRPLASI